MKKLLIFAALAVGVIAFTSATAEARPYGSYSHGHRGSSSCGKSYHHYPTYRYPSYGSSSFHFCIWFQQPVLRSLPPFPAAGLQSLPAAGLPVLPAASLLSALPAGSLPLRQSLRQ